MHAFMHAVSSPLMLMTQGILHMDLASRNCLVHANSTVKISDLCIVCTLP